MLGQRRTPRAQRSSQVGHRRLLQGGLEGAGPLEAGRPLVEVATGVDGDGPDDHQAADHVLEEGVDRQHVHHAVHHREDADAGEGAEDVALAAREHRAAEHDSRDRHQVVAALGADRRAADAEPGQEQESRRSRPAPSTGRARRRPARTCAARQPRHLGVAADGVEAVAEAGTPQQQDRDRGRGQHDHRRERHRADLGRAEQPEVARGGPVAALVVRREVAADHEADAEGRDEAMDVQEADDQAVGQPDQGGDGERSQHAGDDVLALAGHDPAGDQAGEGDDVRHRQVEAADQDHQRLTDGDEAQHAGGREQRVDVGRAEEVAALGRREDGGDHEGEEEQRVDDARRGQPLRHGAHPASSSRLVHARGHPEHLLLGRPGGQLAGDAAVLHHEDAVGHADHLGQLARHHQHGDALGGQCAHELVDRVLRADVDAAGGLVHEDDPRPRCQPAREHDLLLVAAGEELHLLVHRLRRDRE